MSAPFDKVVQGLLELLGPRLVAYLGEVRETRAVHEWASGQRSPKDPEIETRLRVADQAARLLNGRDTAGVVQAWFQGLNPKLNDRSPARLLVEEPLAVSGAMVLSAARAFAAVG
ncbi:MAG: hypothetical protein ACC652_06845 [Acidimicrobiales bacterium]